METNEGSGQRVLVFAPIGRDGRSVSELLIRSGIQTSVCQDFAALLRGLEDGADAAIVAEEGLFGQPLALLDDWLASQPPWSDLPFVMLTSHHEEPNVARWRHEQIRRLGNVSLIERPVQAITLLSVMRAALRARRRQLEIRTHLAARESAAAELESLVQERTAQLQTANVALRDEMNERARVEQSLRHAQKLEAVGQLTGGIAHDFNNLLMVITAGLELMERRDDPKRRETLLRGMRQAAQRGAALTRQLLAFSRSRELRPESVDLARLIGDMRALLDRSLRGDIAVNVALADDIWPVMVDPGELELVLLNLAVNARDAMENGGTITIVGENRIDDGGAEGGEFVRLAVRDTGCGMSDDIKSRVFEPFFTTKDVGKGSGLGLAQVYGFARQSGGSVSIDSMPGQGTTITMMLPKSNVPIVNPGPAAEAESVHESASERCVLLVEDDVEVASLVEQMLRGIGYEVVHAASASAALGALANGRNVDLIFSDVMMPGGTNGIQLASEVRKRRPDLPILLTSGFTEAVSGQAQAMGIPVLRKPYGVNDLRAAIEHQLSTSSA
ncbi:MAG TPA: ATP-binding protein [Pseudoxanthomonas sp.]|nr:ATP-binding protein [Pseudoxanthomonas sp.]